MTKLTPVQAEVLARLTSEWQAEWMLVGAQLVGRRLSGTHQTLAVLVRLGYAEWRRRPHAASYDYDYRLAQKGDGNA